MTGTRDARRLPGASMPGERTLPRSGRARQLLVEGARRGLELRGGRPGETAHVAGVLEGVRLRALAGDVADEREGDPGRRTEPRVRRGVAPPLRVGRALGGEADD